MKIITLFLPFTLCILNFTFAQTPLVKQWEYRFGGNGQDLIQSFQLTHDGGYILGGYIGTDSSGDITEPSCGNTDYWIIKTNALGIKQWDKRFGGSNVDAFYDVQQTTDNGCILGGWSNSDSSSDKSGSLKGSIDYWILKIDLLGNKEWDKDYGGFDQDVLLELKQTIDGGYILGGQSYSDSSGDKSQHNWGVPGSNQDWWVIKNDSIGNKQWDKRYGGLQTDNLTTVNQTTDGGYLFGGSTDSDIRGEKTQVSQGLYDYWIVKTDALGNKQRDKRYGGTQSDELHSILLTPDGGYLLGAESNSSMSGDKTQNTWGSSDMWLINIDSLGTVQWDKDYGGSSGEELHRIIRHANGNYLISRDSYSNTSGDKTENNLGVEQSWLLKLDSSGNKIWNKTIQTSGHDETSMIVIANDGCYTIANWTDGGIGANITKPTRGDVDYWMLKFCDSTQTTSIASAGNLQNQITAFQNPATDLLNIKVPAENIFQLNKLIIKNMLDQTIYVDENNFQQTNISQLAKGIYTVELITNKGNWMRNL